jgi:hypothetical protein
VRAGGRRHIRELSLVLEEAGQRGRLLANLPEELRARPE